MPVARALSQMGYSSPTPIQEAIIPLVRAGRDVVGQSQTGTGKTAAFGIPLVESLDPSTREPQVLVLAPTRELAMQVDGELSRLGQFAGIKSVAIFGGQAMSRQLDSLRKGVHILVATPGRLLDHVNRRTVQLGGLRAIVLDEADRMLDIGFLPDIERILRGTPRTRQTLLFSATMPRPIRTLTNRYLKEPEWVRVGGDAEPVDEVEQVYYEIASQDRAAALNELLEEPDRITQALVFMRTKVGADRLVAHLRRLRHDVEAMHSDMTQAHRTATMDRFRARKLRVLVATNVAARGLDIPAVSHVINYDMPDNLEEYVHRIGRTARMGRPGTAITFVSDLSDFSLLDVIQEHVGGAVKPKRLALLYG